MKIAILGFGQQGRSAYEYWREGNEITVCDADEGLELPEDVVGRLGAAYLEDLEKFDLIVRSPGIHPREIVAANPDAILAKVTTATNEFLRVCPAKQVIGVTGTKGKGTTSTLIAQMLEAADKRVHLGGNIGISPLDMLHDDIKSDDWVVLELANYQLIDLQYSPPLAVCLMVVPEHLDWHEDEEEYYAAKSRLFEHQTTEDTAVYFAGSDTSKQIAAAGEARKVPYYAEPGAIVKNGVIKIEGKDICAVAELKLLGQHNWQNACAAVTAVWQISQDIEAIRGVLTSFSGLEHRLELVRELDGVRYYNDSFGTTPETATVAIQAFEEPKVIILGGSDKGADYSKLAKVVAEANIRKVLLIGDQAAQIEAALRGTGVAENLMENGGSDMKTIVHKAKAEAEPGDVVLLSPACASFDMFKNYKDRGEQFKRAVAAL